MALGSTQRLTEMSTRSISWGTGGRCVRLTTLQPSCAVVMKSGNLNFLEPSGPLQACNGTGLPFQTQIMISVTPVWTNSQVFRSEASRITPNNVIWHKSRVFHQFSILRTQPINCSSGKITCLTVQPWRRKHTTVWSVGLCSPEDAAT